MGGLVLPSGLAAVAGQRVTVSRAEDDDAAEFPLTLRAVISVLTWYSTLGRRSSVGM